MVKYTLWDPNLGNVDFAKAVLSVVPQGAGNAWYVNETTGSDAFPGTASQPFATLAAALVASVANNGDVIFLTGSVHTTATLTWNKAGVSLVGITAPSGNDRARIASSGATAFSPLVNVTVGGCSFINIGTFHGGFTGATGSQVCWNDAGGRNYYSNCQFFGGGDLTTAALAGMRSLTITGVGENLFLGCSIGLDTILRATNANASLELIGGTTRNKFKNCMFQSWCSASTDRHVLCAVGGMDRYTLFDNCVFSNFSGGGGTTLAAVMTVDASAGGNAIVNGGISVGATAIATTGPVFGPNALGATTSVVGLALT